MESNQPDYKRVFESTPVPFLLLGADTQFTILDASDAYLQATGRRRDELVGRALFDAFSPHPDPESAASASKTNASLQRVLKTRRADAMPIQRYDVQRADKGGGGFESRYWSLLNTPVFADDGKICYIVHRVEDVTALMVASQGSTANEDTLRLPTSAQTGDLGDAMRQLLEREEHLRAIVETSPECVKLVARDGTLLQMNGSGLAMIGAESAAQVVGEDVYKLIAPEYRARYRDFNERVCNGEKGTLEFDLIGLGGQRRNVETHAAPLHLSDGRTVQLALTRDITARRKAESALRDSDRRKDEFIATLSHELRNPLAPLRNALSVLRMPVRPAVDIIAVHDMMERQLNHLVRLVDDLLEISRINRGILELRQQQVELSRSFATGAVGRKKFQ